VKVAIVEDENKLAELLDHYLCREGYTTERFSDGELALASLVESPPDLVLLDLMLPGLDGMSICRELRRTSQVPIMELGADDYVCKPFSPREVVARVKAVLRRTVPIADDEIDERFKLDPDTASVKINDQLISLTLVELELLKALSSRQGTIFSRSQLMERIYSDNRVVSDRTIDSHIKKLRQKLREISGDHEYVHSVYGIGYKFELPEREPRSK